MSLLNQVLQDLDARAPAVVRHPVRRAEASAVVDPDEKSLFQRRPDWRQLVIWGLVGAAVMLWAWRFFTVSNVGDVPAATATAIELPPASVTASGGFLRRRNYQPPAALVRALRAIRASDDVAHTASTAAKGSSKGLGNGRRM